MSNSHPLRPYTAVGEIDHVHILSENVGGLMNGEEYSDVTFIVEKKRFPAHRVILAARCHYFRALLYGGMRESQPEAEIPLQDTTAEAFTMLLKYIYTGRATLRDEKEEVLLDFLSLAHKYGFPELEDSTSEYLCTILNIQNVCMTFDVASLYSLPKLTCMCCMFMDRNAQEVLSSEGFLSLSKAALLNVVLRDSFAAPEKDIFQALMNWCKHNPKENHAEIMQAVRLPLMSLTELLNVVRPSGLLSPDAILDAIKVRSESRDMDLNYRGMLIPGENIATMKYGAQVVKGELKSALLDGDTQNYDLDHGFSRHPIDDDCRSGIEIKLGQPSIINHIRILLWDRDSRSYSYYIEVSMDELDWIRVIDHSKYLCRSWQKLYFPARVCRRHTAFSRRCSSTANYRHPTIASAATLLSCSSGTMNPPRRSSRCSLSILVASVVLHRFHCNSALLLVSR
nr:BTB/POZ domain-containing protein 9 isoform X1 [Chrysemys picta bellii]XP_042704434.1 BTB/POZ domain-containing protein 9 isoform X1 [Chrysemys picta bellii]